MAHVARVTAFQLSNPVAVFVLMKSDYSLHHRFTRWSQKPILPCAGVQVDTGPSLHAPHLIV